MKLKITEGNTLRLQFNHFCFEPGRNSTVKLDSLPTEGVLMHRGNVVLKAGAEVSTSEIMMGNLVYVPAPGQSVSTVFDYTVQTDADQETSGYIIFDPAEAVN